MRPRWQSALVTVVAAGCAVLLPAAAAQAAPRAADELGYDVSHPQCGEELPTGQAFAVVGVNSGVATGVNPCLVDQLRWADRSTGDAAGQPAVQLYVNTANPGQVRELVSTWPSSGDTPYGECAGDNDTACSWAYGWTRASVDIHAFLLPAAREAGTELQPSATTWWLDVETGNTWQQGSDGALARNRAALEGMAAYLGSTGAEVGVYSTGQQWRQIAGRVPSSSPLTGLDSWLAGAEDRGEALEDCADDPLLAGGEVLLVQYVAGDLDHDVSCVEDPDHR